MPLLTTDLEYHEPSDDNASILPMLPLTGYITLPNSIESMVAAIDILDDDLNYNPDSKNMVGSIDFECLIYDFCRVKVRIKAT